MPLKRSRMVRTSQWYPIPWYEFLYVCHQNIQNDYIKIIKYYINIRGQELMGCGEIAINNLRKLGYTRREKYGHMYHSHLDHKNNPSASANGMLNGVKRWNHGPANDWSCLLGDYSKPHFLGGISFWSIHIYPQVCPPTVRSYLVFTHIHWVWKRFPPIPQICLNLGSSSQVWMKNYATFETSGQKMPETITSTLSLFSGKQQHTGAKIIKNISKCMLSCHNAQSPNQSK